MLAKLLLKRLWICKIQCIGMFDLSLLRMKTNSWNFDNIWVFFFKETPNPSGILFVAHYRQGYPCKIEPCFMEWKCEINSRTPLLESLSPFEAQSSLPSLSLHYRTIQYPELFLLAHYVDPSTRFLPKATFHVLPQHASAHELSLSRFAPRQLLDRLFGRVIFVIA